MIDLSGAPPQSATLKYYDPDVTTFCHETISDYFVVYAHIVGFENPDRTYTTRLMYIGQCKLIDLWMAPDARHNSEWINYVAKAPSVRTVIIATTTKAYEAFNLAIVLARSNQAYCNMLGHRISNRIVVTNTTTGQVFANAAAAAKFHAFSASTMSNHLNRRAGYKTIRGMVFERGGTISTERRTTPLVPPTAPERDEP